MFQLKLYTKYKSNNQEFEDEQYFGRSLIVTVWSTKSCIEYDEETFKEDFFFSGNEIWKSSKLNLEEFQLEIKYILLTEKKTQNQKQKQHWGTITLWYKRLSMSGNNYVKTVFKIIEKENRRKNNWWTIHTVKLYLL